MTASTAPSRAPTADPSARFVLPAEAFYLKNLAALWSADPRLAAAIEATENLPSYPVEPSRSGLPTALVPSEAGRQIYLHSRYDPADEARKLIAPLEAHTHVGFYVHGMGLGYALELAFDEAGGEALFFIFEPDLLLLRTAFESRDLSRLIASNRLSFFWELEKAKLFLRLTRHGAMLSVGCASLEHAPSAQRCAAFHQQMRAWIEEWNSYCRTSLNTLVVNGRRTAENITRNLGWYVSAPGIGRLKDRYKGYPAVIVSAGPSLRKNKHLLAEIAGRAVIVAVQTTLQPLLEMGVEPHFVTSLDYHTICTRFFEKLPPGLRTELVAEAKATSEIFRLNPGPLSLVGSDFAEHMLHEMAIRKPMLQSGATVAHLAYYLCEYLGCDPIIFVGQDLGFSDGLCYTPGTSYEDVWRPELSRFCTVEMKQWEQIARDRPILRQIPDQQGRPMYTEERLFAYLQQFERDFAGSSARIIDATEGGALKCGAAVMPLADAMREHCTRPLPETPADHAALQPERVQECLLCLDRRLEDAARIAEISRETLPLLEEIRDHLQEQSRVNQAIARIDVLRNRMNELGRSYDLIMQLTQSTEMRRFEADRLLAASKLSGAGKQRRQVMRDIDNVQAVIEAAEGFQQLVEQAIVHLRREFAHALETREAA